MPLFFSWIFRDLLWDFGMFIGFLLFFKTYFLEFLWCFSCFFWLYGIILEIWWDITKNYGTFCRSQEIPKQIFRGERAHFRRFRTFGIGIYWDPLEFIGIYLRVAINAEIATRSAMWFWSSQSWEASKPVVFSFRGLRPKWNQQDPKAQNTGRRVVWSPCLVIHSRRLRHREILSWIWPQPTDVDCILILNGYASIEVLVGCLLVAAVCVGGRVCLKIGYPWVSPSPADHHFPHSNV